TTNLTAAVTFTRIQSLLGGSGDDTFTLDLKTTADLDSKVLGIDGGAGNNTLQARLDAGAAAAPADQAVWTITGQGAGWVADRGSAFDTGTTFVTGPFKFDLAALNGGTLNLPSHPFATGDAVVYRAPLDGSGKPVPIRPLADNAV